MMGEDPFFTEIACPCALSYEEFYQQYLVLNKPCILRNFLQYNTWAASTDWVKDGKPDLEFFARHFSGSVEVPISYCHNQFFNSQRCEMETIGDYKKYWESDRAESKYLKDWHFQLDAQKTDTLNSYRAYTTPSYFSSDWLNEWLDFRELKEGESRSDYRFVYVGPKGSFTPFHCDVFGSFSWSANVIGRKKWIFVALGEERKVEEYRDKYVFDIKSPSAEQMQKQNGRVAKCEIIQESGDVIFVPSGWYHQVHNEEDTISVNHNWFNAANIHLILQALNQQLTRVEKEIADCGDDPDWNKLCQNLLREHHGLNHLDLQDLLQLIIQRRASVERRSMSEENDLQIAQEIFEELSIKIDGLNL